MADASPTTPVADYTPLIAGASPDHPVVDANQYTKPAGPSLLVTSSSSRSTTASNAASLAQKIAALPITQNQTTTSVTGKDTTTPPVTTKASDTTKYGPVGPYGNSTGAQYLDAHGNAVDAQGNVLGSDGKPQVVNGQPVTSSPVWDASTGGAFKAPTNTNPDSTTSDTTKTNSGGNSGVPSYVTDQYNQSQSNLAQEATDAKTSLDQMKASSDAATANLIAMIQSKYDVQIKQMQDKNHVLLGSYMTNAARSGGLQYANDMTSSFMSGEQDKANARITALQEQEAQLIMKAQQAHDSNSIKLFNDYSNQLDKINKSKADAVQKLFEATNKVVAQNLAEKKQQDAEAKTKFANDLKTATGVANSSPVLDAFGSLTSEKDQSDFINELAKRMDLDPAVLGGELSKAYAKDQKDTLGVENTKNIIANRNKNADLAAKREARLAGGGTPGGSTDVNPKTKLFTATGLTSVKSALTKGGEYGGAKYNGIGADGFVDPDLYTAIYNGTAKNIGDRAAQQFLDKYPPEKYINPTNATNAKLPDPIKNRVAAKASKSGGAVIPQ